MEPRQSPAACTAARCAKSAFSSKRSPHRPVRDAQHSARGRSQSSPAAGAIVLSKHSLRACRPCRKRYLLRHDQASPSRRGTPRRHRRGGEAAVRAAWLRRHHHQGRSPAPRACPRRWCSSISRARPHSTRRSCGSAATGDPGLERLARARSRRPRPWSRWSQLHDPARGAGRGRRCRGEKEVEDRLALHSLVEDGEYVRLVSDWVAERILPEFQASFAAADAAGDLRPGAAMRRNAFWFAHHVAAMTALRPAQRPAGLSLSRAARAGDAATLARFVLRGIGLADRAIEHTCTRRLSDCRRSRPPLTAA